VSKTQDMDSVRDLAALYALGQLPADQARAFEARLAAGDEACRSELAAFCSVVDDLGYAARPQQPPPGLRARLLERIAAADPAVIDHAGVHFVRSGQFDWTPGVAPGVEVKRLFEDRERERVTLLVRMAPGASFPDHRHADVEELYLVEGEVFVSGVLMRAGDYCRSEPDSVHDRIHTQSGCLFIAIASQRNQYLA
jgi:quercetin dioxygenase-like cupin family protein